MHVPEKGQEDGNQSEFLSMDWQVWAAPTMCMGHKMSLCMYSQTQGLCPIGTLKQHHQNSFTSMLRTFLTLYILQRAF